MSVKQETTAIIGLGYVGLPLLLDFCESGLNVIGFDIDQDKIEMLRQGKSYISYISGQKISRYVNNKQFTVTANFNKLKEAKNIIIAVPTPLNDHREPDLQFVENTARAIAKYLVSGQLVVLESTTYPGTTREIVQPILNASGLTVGKDYYLAYSPERVDPNNNSYSARDIPKVMGGITNECLARVKALYGMVFKQIVPVSSVEAAEASKLLENIFRSVNIALVNEMKMLFDRMGIDVWEVIRASSTKPFGFMPFYPGPGLGGHCIPIDPFYLTWKAREFDFSTRFIELAGEINTQMPYYVVNKTIEALNDNNKAIKGAKILILGAAYKNDVDDVRESPALKIISLLKERKAEVNYYDPFINHITDIRKYPDINMHSVELNDEILQKQDCVIILTAHSNIDYRRVLKHSKMVIDTRNVLSGIDDDKIIKA